jgi:hypothetical protein
MEPAAQRVADPAECAPGVAEEGVVEVLGRSRVASDGREQDERTRMPAVLTRTSMAQAGARHASSLCYIEPLTESPTPPAFKAGVS